MNNPHSSGPNAAPHENTLPARILVVDDQPANIQVVGTALGKLGHEIIPATDGATALKRLAARLPDLILLDLLMPEMDGCEVCRQLKSNPLWKDIPVIFLSAADDKDLIVRAFESGGVDYITKPFHRAELISRVRTQLSLKWANDRLRQLAEDKDELMGMLTHDLKGHLGGLQMSAQLLGSRMSRLPNPDEKTLQLAENIERCSGQLLRFVKEFLANAAADHGMPVRSIKLNLRDAAEATVSRYREAAKRKQQIIETTFPAESIEILADPSALDQVLDNLISNALKFSPSGSPVHVRALNIGNHVECWIEDHGPGFTSEDRSRMFQRYARLSARPTGGEPSTGLGLSIVQKLVLAMNGELDVRTTPGGGATFLIRFPQTHQH